MEFRIFLYFLLAGHVTLQCCGINVLQLDAPRDATDAFNKAQKSLDDVILNNDVWSHNGVAFQRIASPILFLFNTNHVYDSAIKTQAAQLASKIKSVAAEWYRPDSSITCDINKDTFIRLKSLAYTAIEALSQYYANIVDPSALPLLQKQCGSENHFSQLQIFKSALVPGDNYEMACFNATDYRYSTYRELHAQSSQINYMLSAFIQTCSNIGIKETNADDLLKVSREIYESLNAISIGDYESNVLTIGLTNSVKKLIGAAPKNELFFASFSESVQNLLNTDYNDPLRHYEGTFADSTVQQVKVRMLQDADPNAVQFSFGGVQSVVRFRDLRADNQLPEVNEYAFNTYHEKLSSVIYVRTLNYQLDPDSAQLIIDDIIRVREGFGVIAVTICRSSESSCAFTTMPAICTTSYAGDEAYTTCVSFGF